MENAAQKNVPLWAAIMISHHFLDTYAQQLQTTVVPFDGTYDGIDASRWCREVISHFEELMRKYAEGLIPLPVKPDCWDNLLFSLSSQKNRKPKMEDRHIILPTFAVLNEEEHSDDSLFAVFDGHHGPECASYASAHFHTCLLQLKGTSTKEELMQKTFELLDHRLTVRCEKESIKSGTTAICVYISEGVAYTGWCGDSSIGILQKDKVITISKRHSPSDPVEQKRIEEAGGMVVNIQGEPRVNGVLNVSRSLGDIQAKPMVSSTPDTDSYTLSKDQDFLLFLASDGVWDMVSECEIFNTTKEFFETHDKKDYEKLADVISQKAKENGSSDNLTLIAVFLQPLDTLWKIFGSKAATD